MVNYYVFERYLTILEAILVPFLSFPLPVIMGHDITNFYNKSSNIYC